MIGISSSLLTSYLNGRVGLAEDGTQRTAPTAVSRQAKDARAKALTAAPWTPANAPKPATSKTRLDEIMSGKPLVAEGVTSAGGGRKTDQQQLFGAWRALEGLRLIAERAQTDGVPADEMVKLQTRFRAGMAEVSKYLGAMDLQKVFAPVGDKADQVQGVFGVRKGRTEFVTKEVYAGAVDQEVPAWRDLSGFQIVANRGEVGEKTVTIDLSALGSTPRSMDVVLGLINAKLAEAGLTTRFSRVQLPAKPDAKPGDPPSFALSIKGAAEEQLAFSAIQGTPRAAVTALTTSGAENMQTARLSKFAPADGADDVFTQTANADPLRFKGAGATGLTMRAMAEGDDGSVYVVGETTMPVDGNGGLKGAADAVLSKYDSAGRLVWSRVLGAATSAQGYGVAFKLGVVAVTGTFSGAIDTTTSKGGTDAMVATFTEDGDERWVRQVGGTGADEASAVTIGDDLTVYVGGRTKNQLGAGAAGGGWDGFVASFSTDGAAGYVRQFSEAGDGAVTALRATAGGLFVAGSALSAGVVRKLDTNGTDMWSISTGSLGAGGGITSIDADASGRIAIAGATTSASLGLGGAEDAAVGKLDGFVALLQDGAAPTALWTRRLGGAGDDSAAGVRLAADGVYVGMTETIQQPSRTGVATTTTRAAVERLAFPDGAQAWRATVGEAGERAVGVALGVSYKDLDAFGLPSGDLNFEGKTPLVTRTALREGDYFTLKIDGGSARKIEIEADDTMADLVTKLNGVLRSAGKAEVTTLNGAEFLVIKASEGRRIDLAPGAAGADALAVLGLNSGEVRKAKRAPAAGTSTRSLDPPVMPLNFRDDLAFSDASSARKVRLDIERVQNSVRTAFEYIYNPPKPAKKTADAAKTGTVSPALKSQLANYEAGLARLTGGGTTDATTGGNPLLGLYGFKA